MAKRSSPIAYVRGHPAFVTLVVLLVATVLLGGGSRDDITSLVVLRPLGAICLGIGLATLTREQWQSYRVPLAFMGAIIGLIVLHLIPLPPVVWQALPGRELAIAAGEAVGGIEPWRPISLVPYRGWNALYSMLIPAAAMVLAVQIRREDHRRIAYFFIGAAVLSALWGMVQSISGFAPGFYFYRITSTTSPTGLFANRNHMAALLICAVPLLVLFASRAKGPRRRTNQVGWAAIGALAVLMATATGSRAGIAMSLVALATSWLVWRARPRDDKALVRRDRRQPWVPYAMAGFGVAILAAAAFLLTRSQSFARISAGGTVEEYRFTVWQSIVDFMPQYLPFGSGVGSFVEVFQVHEPGDLLNTSFWNHAHNDWLEWLLEGGVPMALIFVAGIFFFLRRVVALIRRSHTGQLEVQLGLAGGIILFVLGLWSGVDYPLRVPVLATFAAIAAVWLAFPAAGQAMSDGSVRGGGWSGSGASKGSLDARPARES